MDQIRKCTEWVTAHKIVSLTILLVLLVCASALRYVLNVTAGQISDPIVKGDIIDAVYGIGTITPYNRFSFNPLVGRTVDKIFVLEGDHVKKGTVIARTQEGELERAPFEGTVNFLPYRAGENVYSTTPMMILTDMSHVYIVVSMEQQGALRVKPGQTAKISIDSLRQHTFEGKVSAVYSYSSSFLARIDAVDLPPSVLPDMTCDVAMVISVHKNVLLIPVVAFENGHVWVKRGRSLPRQIEVNLGVSDGTSAEVTSGDLHPGDRLMIRRQVTP